MSFDWRLEPPAYRADDSDEETFYERVEPPDDREWRDEGSIFGE